MQHKATAFARHATIAVALLALCVGVDLGRAAERLAQGSGAAAPGATAPAVSQQAILMEEDATPEGTTSYGTVAWRTALLPPERTVLLSPKRTVPSSPGTAKPGPAVLAEITIPGRLVASLTLRRNTDRAIPTSHIIEITFNRLLNSLAGGVSNVPGFMMKVSSSAKGEALAGLAIKMNDSSFLVGLSAANPQMQDNLQLLKDRDWLEALIVYNNGQRAILVLQKGPAGARAFADAFSAWKQ